MMIFNFQTVISKTCLNSLRTGLADLHKVHKQNNEFGSASRELMEATVQGWGIRTDSHVAGTGC